MFGTDWDYLIVLDACRYDAFESVYEEYLDGDLERRRSPGSATPEWASKTFTGQHDLVYFSTIPFINSLGIPLCDLRWGASCDYDWAAADHIDEVVDLWREAWDDDLGAVTPEAVTAAARERLDDGSDRRMVVHYLQPHAPYLRRGKGRKLRQIRAGVTDAGDRSRGTATPDGDADGYRGVLRSVGDDLRSRVESALGDSRLAMQLGMLVELDVAALADLRTDGVAAVLKRYHEENLRLALESAADLIEDLDGRVVVTADHGEAFGEQGVWEHHIETYIPPLVDVPWLVVE